MVSGGFRGSDIVIYDVDNAKQMALFEECGVCPAGSAAEVVSQVDAVVFAVKPQVFPSVLSPLAATLQSYRPLIISIAAGKTIASIEDLIGVGLPVVRVMPNINAKVGEAMSAFCGNAQVGDAHRDMVRTILGAVGEVMELEEKLFSAFSTLAGCSPAFALLYIDALAEAGVRYGIPKALSLKIVSQTVLGTARLLQESGEHPRALMDQVCSPAGTTIEGVAALQQGGFETAILEAARASYERDKQL
jgi:pyrroline-5-carboxylate reductase